MSKYDTERETMGLKPMVSSSTSRSKYDTERESSGLKSSSSAKLPTSKYAEERNTLQKQPNPAEGLAAFGLDVLHPPSLSSVLPPPTSPKVQEQPEVKVKKKPNLIQRIMAYNPFNKIAEYAAPDAPLIGPHGEIPGTNARQRYLQDNPPVPTGNKTYDKITDFIGQIGSMFVPVGTGGTLINDLAKGTESALATKTGQKLLNASGKAATKSANVLNPVLNKAGINISTDLANKSSQALVRGGSLGAAYGASQPLVTGNNDLTEVPKSALENAIMFGVGDAALPVLGAGAKAILSKVKGTPMPALPDYSQITLSKGKGTGVTKSMNEIQSRSNNSMATPVESQMVPINKPPTSVIESKKPINLDDLVKSRGFNEANPETIAQTYNNKDWYHGTGKTDLTGDRLDPFVGNHESLFGQGVYMTDNPNIAQGYANSKGKRSGTPTIYKANINLDRVLDIEKAITPDVKAAVEKTVKPLDAAYQREFGEPDYFTNTMQREMSTEGATPETVITALRKEIGDFSHEAMLPTSEFVEDFQDLAMNLKEIGYDALTHTGGLRTGKEPHRVLIMLDPQNWHLNSAGKGSQITNFERYTKPEEIQPAVNGNTDPLPANVNSVVEPATMPLPIEVAKPPENQVERGFVTTLKESEKPPQGFKEKLKAAYTPITNEATVAAANKRVSDDLESSASFVMGDSGLTPEKIATSHRLIDEFIKQGNHQRAVDIAEKIAEEGTKAGQSIQAFSIYNRLSAEGILIHAQRIAAKTNETLPLYAPEVKVTPEMAAKITDLAETNKIMTGVKDLSNDVFNILDRAKKGEALSAADAETLQRFVEESKQFIKEVKPKPQRPPKPPSIPKDKRVRDNVMTFLDAQANAAKERLRAKGIQVSSTPLDIWADYAIIGAAKLAKGTIKFADWSAEMVKDLGETIRPHLQTLYDRSKETFEISTKKVTSQTISRAEKITERAIKNNKNLTIPQIDSLRILAQKVSGLSGFAKITASQDLQVLLQSLQRPGILKKISTFQTIGQLLNPKTQVRNSLGNELFYRLERLNKLIATPIDIIRSKITKGPRTVTFRTNNQGEYWKNFIHGAVAGWKGVNVNGLQTQYDITGQTFRSKYNPLTYMEKALGASLRSFDNAAYSRAYNDTLGELATLRAINEGKGFDKDLIHKYIRKADDHVIQLADEYGKYVTFQDNNFASVGLQKLKRGLNLGKDFGLGDLILKYPKTPGALLMRALEYSPAGFLRSAAILTRPIFKKSVNNSEVLLALTRAIVGTAGLTGMGFLLLDKGILTGSASKDKDVRGLQKSAGQGQYQVNLSALFRLVKSGFDDAEAKVQEGDQLYTYDWMQPVSMAVSMGANTAKNAKQGKAKLSGLPGVVFNSLEGGIGTLTEQSVLSGLKNAVQGYPGQTVTDKITDVLSSLPASFVPTYLNQTKQLMDNTTRETYSPNKIQQSLNRAKARIPVAESQLPVRYDTLGQAMQTYQNNSPFNVLFNPGFVSRYKLSPEAKVIVDLMNDSGDEAVAPRVPDKSITVDGQKVTLDGDEFSRLQQLQGEQTKYLLERNSIEKGSLKDRVTMAKNILTESGKVARDKLVKEYPELKPKKTAP